MAAQISLALVVVPLTLGWGTAPLAFLGMSAGFALTLGSLIILNESRRRLHYRLRTSP